MTVPRLNVPPQPSTVEPSDHSRNLSINSRIPGKDVFILGSGFSAGMGIPTIANFIPEGLRLLKLRKPYAADPAKYVQPVIDVLAKYGARIRATVSNEPNLEDCFCAVDAAGCKRHRNTLIEFVRHVCTAALARHLDQAKAVSGNHNQLPEDRRFLPTVPRNHAWPNQGKDYLPVSLWEDQREPVACIYESFLSQLFIKAARLRAQQGDDATNCDDHVPAIVSLNYDLLLEEKLWGTSSPWSPGAVDSNAPLRNFCYGKGISLQERDIAANALGVPLIKLHGSLNWCQQSDGSASAFPTQAVVSNAVPLVIPSWVRGPVNQNLFGDRVDDALTHLRRADRIIVVGYSMPPTDRYLQFIFARGLDTPEVPTIEIYSRLEPEEATRRGREMFGARVPIHIRPPTGTPRAGFDLESFLRLETPAHTKP